MHLGLEPPHVTAAESARARDGDRSGRGRCEKRAGHRSGRSFPRRVREPFDGDTGPGNASILFSGGGFQPPFAPLDQSVLARPDGALRRHIRSPAVVVFIRFRAWIVSESETDDAENRLARHAAALRRRIPSSP